jgi:hypothetical protein
VRIDTRMSRRALWAFAWCALAPLILTLCNKVQAAARCPQQTTRSLQVGESTLCLMLDEAAPAKLKVLEQAWIERSAHIVAAYYGRFPAPLVVLRLRSGDGAGVNGGRTTNDD